jgi:SAM-dependent methyltransferase
MRDPAHAVSALAAAALLLQGAALHAAPAAEPFKPELGQAGKDVIWVPTAPRAVERMLTLADVGPQDFVIDLGSGDGRIVIAAALKHGARGVGVDLNPEMVKLSQQRARAAGVAERVQFFVRDLFETDLSHASVVTLYLLPELNLRLRPKLLGLAPGTRIVANAFDMGEWEPDVFDAQTASALRLWVVPAPVAGRWTWEHRLDGRTRRWVLELNQQFQRVSGVVSSAGLRLRLRDAHLRGAEIRFTLLEEPRPGQGVRYDYAGRVKGDAIEGELNVSPGDTRLRWAATRRSRSTPGRS